MIIFVFKIVLMIDSMSTATVLTKWFNILKIDVDFLIFYGFDSVENSKFYLKHTLH